MAEYASILPAFYERVYRAAVPSGLEGTAFETVWFMSRRTTNYLAVEFRQTGVVSTYVLQKGRPGFCSRSNRISAAM